MVAALLHNARRKAEAGRTVYKVVRDPGPWWRLWFSCFFAGSILVGYYHHGLIADLVGGLTLVLVVVVVTVVTCRRFSGS
jgi:hypothetical protein